MSGPSHEEWFRQELPEWALRGLACAGPSGFFALVGEYRAVAELLGMLGGILVWIVAVAWTLSGRWFQQSAEGRAWHPALGQGAWILAGWAIGGGTLGVWASSWTGSWTWALMPFMLPVAAELVSGLVAVRVTEWIGEGLGYALGGQADSFCGTFLTTMFQGAAVVGMMVAVAAGRRGMRWAVIRWKNSRGLRGG